MGKVNPYKVNSACTQDLSCASLESPAAFLRCVNETSTGRSEEADLIHMSGLAGHY